MEIRTYLNSILRYWWLVLLLLVVSGVGAALLDRIKTPTYSTQARLAVRPSPTLSDTRTIVDLIGQIGNRYIAGSYAQAVTSAQVKEAARKAAGLSVDDADNYVLDSAVLPDTAVVQVNATGPNPTILVNYLNACLQATVDTTRDLFRVMELVPLEAARMPSAPITPTPSRDIPFGAALGLGLGIVLALIVDYLRGLLNARRIRAASTVASVAPAEARQE